MNNKLGLYVTGPPASGKTKLLMLITRICKLEGYKVSEVGEHGLELTPPVPAEESEIVLAVQTALNQFRQTGTLTTAMQLRMSNAIKNTTKKE